MTITNALRAAALGVAALPTIIGSLPSPAAAQTKPAASSITSIFNPNSLTFNPALIDGMMMDGAINNSASTQIIAINSAIKQLEQRVPEGLRAEFIANMFQLNLSTPDNLQPFAQTAEEIRALLLQAYLHFEPTGQLQKTGIEKILGIRTDPAGAAEDFFAVSKLWGDRGFVVVMKPDMPPHGPHNGYIAIKAQPCLETAVENGTTILKPQCEVAIPVDSDSRNAARLWLMMRHMDTAMSEDKMKWEPIAGAGKLPATNAKGENVPMALMCKVPNTFIAPDSMRAVSPNTPGAKIFAFNEELLSKLAACFPAAGLDSLRGKLGFRDEANWKPHHPTKVSNPQFKGAVPPPANQ